MSRKLILTLAAAATITVASFASSSSYAHGGGSGHSSGGHSSGGHEGGRVSGGRDGGGRYGGGHKGGSHDGGNHDGGRRIGRNGDRPGHPERPGRWAYHNHGHWIFRGGRWIVIDQVADAVPDVAPVAPVAGSGACTCLTKTYTPDGIVMFADVCTKEAATAPTN